MCNTIRNLQVLLIEKWTAEEKKGEFDHQFFDHYPDNLLVFPFLRASAVTYQSVSKVRLFCSFYVLTMETNSRSFSQNLALNTNAISLL